jgi:phosphoribosylanthranilate isomerase
MWSSHNATRIKICEIESPQDLHAACQAGADALGFHWFRHHEKTERAQKFSALLSLVPPGINRVLLSDLAFDDLGWVVQHLAIDTVQLYPDWGKAEVVALRAITGRAINILKLMSAQPDENHPADIAAFLNEYHEVVDGFLLDSYRAGGTGKTADWNNCATIVQATRRPVMLAGGLTADNVEEAIARVRPWGVDVETGVSDRLTHGPLVKNVEKCRHFVQAVHRADGRRDCI